MGGAAIAAAGAGPVPPLPRRPEQAHTSLRVTGGTGGVAAALGSLETAARTILGASLVIADAGLMLVGTGRGSLGSAVAGSALQPSSVLDPLGAARVQEAGLRAIDGLAGTRSCAASLRLLSGAVSTVVRTYQGADAVVDASVGGLVQGLADVLVPPVERPVVRHVLGESVPLLFAALHASIDKDPDAPPDRDDPFSGLKTAAGDVGNFVATHGGVTLATAAVGGPGVSSQQLFTRAASIARAQGLLGRTRTSVRAITIGTSDAAASRPGAVPGPLDPPRRPAQGVGGLIRLTEYLTQGPGRGDPGVSGRVMIQEIPARDGHPKVAIAVIPGTRIWTHGRRDPMDAGSDLLAAAGERTAAQDAVERSLTAAGIAADEPLLLVGHSQGGLTAAGLASDPAFRRRFNPVAAVTAGSPIAADRIPAGVDVLSLEHSDDGVTALDGRANPAGPHQVTVTAATPPHFRPHDHEGYARTGDLVDASDDASITAFKDKIAPFLANGDHDTTVTTTTVFDVKRLP